MALFRLFILFDCGTVLLPLTTQQRLLQRLSDGQIHSGESLGADLQISRAAVWKQIQTLQALGVQIDKVRGQGYRASRLDLLCREVIEQGLKTVPGAAALLLEVLFRVGSTNDYVLEWLPEHPGQQCVVLAEQQDAGRGRRGRSWFSPFASSLYMTVGWRFSEGIAALEGLSLVVGLALQRALQGLGIEQLQLKWPNDLVWQQRKLAGILLEVRGDPAGECQVAVGIGLNVALGDSDEVDIDQPWVDIQSIVREQGLADDKRFTRNHLVIAILSELVPVLETVEQTGFVAAYASEWARHDAFKGCQVVLQAGDRRIIGEAVGVNEAGAYGIRTEQGVEHFNGGEVSLRVQL